MKRSPTADIAALNRVDLITEALITDWARLLHVLHVAQRDNLRASSWSGPYGKGGHSDPTGNLPFTPTGDLAPDKAAGDLAKLDKAITLMLTGATMARGVQLAWLQNPASANWCCNAHGCPTRSKAEPGRRGRCETCYRAWHRSCPHDEEQRTDRQTVGRVAC